MSEVDVPSAELSPDSQRPKLVGLDRLLRISRWSMRVRRMFVIEVHLVLWAGALWLALKLRFDGNVPPEYVAALPVAIVLLVSSRALSFYVLGLFHGLWRYAGVSELERLVCGTTFGTAVFAG